MPSMKTTKFRSGAFSALSIGALLLAGGLVSGAKAMPVSEGSGVDRWVVPKAQLAGDYWTADRMKAALPGDSLVAGKIGSSIVGATAAATERTVTGQLAQPKAAGLVPERPVSHIGKVFFTLGGSNYVCSGNSVAAANKSTVSTAGHCLNEGPGAFATQFTFVPAYENGNAPYGKWTAIELYAPTQWTTGGDLKYDTGFAVVASKNGSTLSDTVGSSGVAFNQARGLNYTLYGYPAAPPFTGETLQSCSGKAGQDTTGTTGAQQVPCDMTGGSSGGPWFIGNGSTGIQNSINSFGYVIQPNAMYGPYWGAVIESTYNAASA